MIRRGWKQRHTVLLLVVAAYFAVRFAQVIIGPVVPLIRNTFAVSQGTIGLALSGMWVTYALLQLPSGVLADRIGGRRVVIVALSITALATLGLAGAPTFSLFGCSAVVLGIGAGLYYNAATALIANEFDGIGWAIGTHRIGGLTAGVIAPMLAAIASVRWGWRMTLGLGSLGAIGIVLGLRWRGRRETRVGTSVSLPDLLDSVTVVRLLRRPRTLYTTFLASLIEFIHLAAIAFLPTLFVEYHALSIAQANGLFAIFFATAASTQPVAGWLSDRIGRDGTISLLFVAGVLGYAMLAGGGRYLVFVPAVVLAGSASSSTTVIQSRMIDGLAEENREYGFGVFRTIYLLIGAAGTTVVGTTADVAGWMLAFAIPPMLLGFGLLSLVAASGMADARW